MGNDQEDISHFVCCHPGCGAHFKDKGVFGTHLRIHNRDVKIYECTFPGCTHRQMKRANVLNHYRRHFKFKYYCRVSGCNISYADKLSRNGHERRLHAGQTIDDNIVKEDAWTIPEAEMARKIPKPADWNGRGTWGTWGTWGRSATSKSDSSFSSQPNDNGSHPPVDDTHRQSQIGTSVPSNFNFYGSKISKNTERSTEDSLLAIDASWNALEASPTLADWFAATQPAAASTGEQQTLVEPGQELAFNTYVAGELVDTTEPTDRPSFDSLFKDSFCSPPIEGIQPDHRTPLAQYNFGLSDQSSPESSGESGNYAGHQPDLLDGYWSQIPAFSDADGFSSLAPSMNQHELGMARDRDIRGSAASAMTPDAAETLKTWFAMDNTTFDSFAQGEHEKQSTIDWQDGVPDSTTLNAEHTQYPRWNANLEAEESRQLEAALAMSRSETAYANYLGYGHGENTEFIQGSSGMSQASAPAYPIYHQLSQSSTMDGNDTRTNGPSYIPRQYIRCLSDELYEKDLQSAIPDIKDKKRAR